MYKSAPARHFHLVLSYFHHRNVMALLQIVGVLSLGQIARSEQIFFALDPSQSMLQMSANIQIPALGANIPTAGQANTGIAVPWFGDGTSSALSGVLSANVDFPSGTLSFGGGSLFGVPSGQWEPSFNGNHGIAPAFVGVAIEAPGLGRAVAAIRDFKADYINAFSVQSLNPSGTGAYSFTTDNWMSIATNVDVEGQTLIAASLGRSRFVLSEKYAAENVGSQGSLTQTTSGNWQVHIPLNLEIYIPAGDTDVGPVNVILTIQGDIVANSVVIPTADSFIESIPGHNTLPTAQLLDGAFATKYDLNVGDSLLNTSAVIPHVTVHGNGDGTLDFYQFTVSQAYSEGIFDIDGANFDSTIFLYDSLGNLIASNDDAPSRYGANGSTSSLDSFIEYVFTKTGTYYLAVGQYTPSSLAALPVDNGVPIDGEYTLHVSVVPETSSILLASIPFVGFIVWGFRRKRRLAMSCLALLVSGTLTQQASASDPLIKKSIEGVYGEDSTYPMPYRFFTPTGYDASDDKEYPLVLFLHGAGERGDDNFFQVANHIDGLIDATQSQKYASFLLAPQLTDYPYTNGWYPSSPFDRTMELLDQVINEYHVDINRIYITGLSMGGYGTFRYMAAFPNLFAAAVPMSGGGSTSTAATIKDIPTWVFHGSADATVPVQYSRNMVNAITAAGGHPLYTEIAGGPHDIWGNIYNDYHTNKYGLYDWMFSQSLSPAASIAAVPEVSTFWMMFVFIAGGMGCYVITKIDRSYLTQAAIPNADSSIQ